MNSAKLVIQDEVNCRFEGVGVETRRKMVQAVEYIIPGAQFSPAARLGRWNGKRSYCDVAGRTYTNLLDRILPVLTGDGYDLEVEDQRESYQFDFDHIDVNSLSSVTWPKNHPLEGQPIMIKPHQVQVVNEFLTNTQGIYVAPTGSGKTMITAILSQKVEKYGRSIVIVPTQDLVTQTEEDYLNLGMDVGVLYGERKDYGKTHTICTWQSLHSMMKNSLNGTAEVSILEFIEGVVCVMVDEAHKGKSSVLRELLSGPLSHIPIRWGLTGTMPKADFESMSVIACIGPVVGQINTRDLQDLGILANLHVNIWQFQDPAGAFKTYADELAWLTSHGPRLIHLASKLTEVGKTGNTMILVDRIQTGESLQKLIPGSIFVNGKTASRDRKSEYSEVQTSDGNILICTFGVASTGININRIFNLVIFEAGKSFVKVIQSIGRGVRVASDKDFVNVYDVCSTTKYSRRHHNERKKFYDEAQYPYTTTKIRY